MKSFRRKTYHLMKQYASAPGTVTAFTNPYLQDLKYDELRVMLDLLNALADYEDLVRSHRQPLLRGRNKTLGLLSMDTRWGPARPAYLLADEVQEVIQGRLREELLSATRNLRGAWESVLRMGRTGA